MPDFSLWYDGGTVGLITPNTNEAREHLVENVGEEAIWLGDGLAVEHRYLPNVVERLQDDGWTVGR